MSLTACSVFYNLKLRLKFSPYLNLRFLPRQQYVNLPRHWLYDAACDKPHQVIKRLQGRQDFDVS